MTDEFKFNFGDIVSVIGYEGAAFQVEGYRKEVAHYPGVVTTDLIYELTGVQSPDFLEADEEDLALLAPADQADEYIEQMPEATLSYPQEELSFYEILFGGGMDMAKKNEGERKLTQRELSAQEAAKRKQERKDRAAQIDNLLDIANWNREMLAKTNDEAYGDALFAVEAELKKLVEQD